MFSGRYTLCTRLAIDRNLRASSEVDPDVEFLSVERESPSFFRVICEPEDPAVDDKGVARSRFPEI